LVFCRIYSIKNQADRVREGGPSLAARRIRPALRAHAVKELLANDLAVLHGVEPDLVHLHTLTGRLVGDVELEADDETVVIWRPRDQMARA
jgi:hypothetical protein